MRVAKGWAPALGIGLMVLTVVGAMASGYWSIQGQNVSGGGGGPSRGDVTPNSLEPADLKGWMTIEEACIGLGLNGSELLAAMGLPADTPLSTTLRTLETLGASMCDVRHAAEQLLGRPG